MKIPHDIQNSHPAVQAFYIRMVENGESPMIAELLALRKPPGSLTDRELFKDVGTLEKQFAGDEVMLNHITRVAKSYGYTPNNNDFYNSALAEFTGDPRAFIPATGGREHIRKECERQGKSCEGLVKVKGRKQEVQNVPMADDLIERTAKEAVKADPALGTVPKQELRQEIVKRHSFKGT